MTITSKLVDIALGEWKRFGFSTRPLHGKDRIVGLESAAPYVDYVNDYWKAVGEPTLNGNSAIAWSAAFISFCFKEAGAGEAFPVDAGHAGYCSRIMRFPELYSGLAILDPASAMIAIGDLVLAARSGDGCTNPPDSHDDAMKLLRKGSFFCSHADLVVDVREREFDAVGGNVSNSVTRTTFASRSGKVADPRGVWLAVVRSHL
jgi:hypothetical protein